MGHEMNSTLRRIGARPGWREPYVEAEASGPSRHHRPRGRRRPGDHQVSRGSGGPGRPEAEPAAGTSRETTAERRPAAGRDTAAGWGQAADWNTAAEQGQAARPQDHGRAGTSRRLRRPRPSGDEHAGRDTAAERGTAPDRESESGPGDTRQPAPARGPDYAGHDDVHFLRLSRPDNPAPCDDDGALAETLVGMSTRSREPCAGWGPRHPPGVAADRGKRRRSTRRMGGSSSRVHRASSSAWRASAGHAGQGAGSPDATDGLKSCAPPAVPWALIDRVTVTVPADLLDLRSAARDRRPGRRRGAQERPRAGIPHRATRHREPRGAGCGSRRMRLAGFRDWAEIGPRQVGWHAESRAQIAARRAHARAARGTPAHRADSSRYLLSRGSRTRNHRPVHPAARKPSSMRAGPDLPVSRIISNQPGNSDLDHSDPIPPPGRATCSCNLGPAPVVGIIKSNRRMAGN